MAHSHYATPLLRPDSPLSLSAKSLIRDLTLKEIEKSKNLPTDNPLDPKRKERVQLTRNELFSQPEIISANLTLGDEQVSDFAQYLAGKKIDHIYMTGCGDSIATMIAVRYLWETLLEIPCEPVQALDFAYYYHKPINQNSLVITLSSSGNTTRTVEAMLIAKAKGATTFCLSNTAGSALMTESDNGILIHAERKGWPTQSSTAAMALLYLLGIKFAERKRINESLAHRLHDELLRIPSKIQSAIETLSEPIRIIAKNECLKSVHLFAGGGPAFASAFIGAAKVKECTPNHALAIPLEEYHHYNSQKTGDPLMLLVPSGMTVPRAIDTAKEGKRWGGVIYSVISESNSELEHESDKILFVPEIDDTLAPLVFSIPAQLYAYHLGMEQFSLAERTQDHSDKDLSNKPTPGKANDL